MTLKEVLDDYQKKGLAIPAFNIDCFETFQALEEVLWETKSPLIAQLSPSELEFIKPERFFALAKLLSDSGLPIFLNVDHGRDLDILKKVIDLGFDMIHFDGSNLNLETNLELSQSIISYAHQNGVLVEVEIDHIEETNKTACPTIFTDPVTAQKFMETTQADLLAVSVGNTHGAPASGFETIDLDLLARIRQTLPQTLLTMHGGSGINPEELKKTIKQGIVKININTDLRNAFRSNLEITLRSNESIKAYHLLKAPIEALKLVMKEKLEFFSP
jgi:fructose-bisphosphate aldolase, class II